MLDYAANYGLSQPVFVIIEMSRVIAACKDHNLDSLGTRVLNPAGDHITVLFVLDNGRLTG